MFFGFFNGKIPNQKNILCFSTSTKGAFNARRPLRIIARWRFRKLLCLDSTSRSWSMVAAFKSFLETRPMIKKVKGNNAFRAPKTIETNIATNMHTWFVPTNFLVFHAKWFPYKIYLWILYQIGIKEHKEVCWHKSPSQTISPWHDWKFLSLVAPGRGREGKWFRWCLAFGGRSHRTPGMEQLVIWDEWFWSKFQWIGILVLKSAVF